MAPMASHTLSYTYIIDSDCITADADKANLGPRCKHKTRICVTGALNRTKSALPQHYNVLSAHLFAFILHLHVLFAHYPKRSICFKSCIEDALYSIFAFYFTKGASV